MPKEATENIGLRTLEDISALILHSHDLQETLDNITNLVAKRMHSDVCSIYLLEEDGETLLLQSTKGLSRGSVGKVTMKTSEGLTGLAVEQRGVVNIENAPDHPRYKYFKETREERFQSFLGLPIFDHKTPVGVIVVQTRESRAFTKEEISFLSTIAYQISSIIVNGRLLDSIRKKEEERAFFERELEKFKVRGAVSGERPQPVKRKGKQPFTLKGSPVSPGFSWGKIYILKRRGREGSMELERSGSPQEESKAFHLALEKARIQTLYLEKRVAESLSKEDAAIFHTHLMILEDRGFINKVSELIEQGHSAARAVNDVVDHYVAAFSRMEDPYLRERSADMEDIGRRIIDSLEGNGHPKLKFREKRIIVASEILPSDLATLDNEKILGIVTEKGDVNSHASIMAKSLGIPALVGVEGIIKQLAPRDEMILDANTGHIFINPDDKVKWEYERLQRDYSSKRRELDELKELPAVTTDGCVISLKANIGLISDIRVALANGAEGVGLYRSEFPYMARTAFPSRDELYRLYRRILEGFSPLPVIIRTLDIGGDKGLPYFHYPKEDNPFMGWRSIRVSLDDQKTFRDQLAAVLMASPYGKASLMFPMISGVDEVRAVKAILAEVKDEVTRRGFGFDPDIKVGIMVEVPAAVQTADLLAREVDFFSIGTNDLIQYTLAADRNNPKVKKYYEQYHPAVLHSIKRVVEAAQHAGIGLSICGEMATEPLNAMLLIGMGITELSLSAPYIPVVKQAIRGISMDRARELAQTVLGLDSSEAVRNYLAEWREEAGV
ncbi:MAG: phosphoenolpyruvate--protein phosphotransferase [Geobacter sp.]|nr:phosphoenolpyruvate--protein phosphotransferase [Geobacter sp.]